MGSSSREEIGEAVAAMHAGMDRLLGLSFDVLTPRECLALLQHCEKLRRQLPAVEHPLINQLAAQAEASELGGKLAWALADRLRITRGAARRRIADAADLGPRTGLTGEPLEPQLAATAAAQRAGRLNVDHVQVIRGFFAYLPDHIDPDTCRIAERQLAELGRQYRPDELAKLAQRLADCLHPDGNFSDEHRAHRRTLVLGPQDRDGMTPIKGFLDPAARAAWDAIAARWAAPGMCNPHDPEPCVAGTPSQQAIDADHRTLGQRNHDALAALCRAMLASGDLGQHNGLPATIIASATLAELEAGIGKAITGGGSWLPMSDVIAMASNAHHYLRIYDGAKELALFHTKRLASPAQRIVLYAKERGCSHPNCPIPGYLAEVHHDDDYAHTGVTDIHGLTFKCHPHHDIITTGGWKTRKNHRGETETLPPPHLDHGQARINRYHHPEKLLQEKDIENSEDDDGP